MTTGTDRYQDRWKWILPVSRSSLNPPGPGGKPNTCFIEPDVFKKKHTKSVSSLLAPVLRPTGDGRNFASNVWNKMGPGFHSCWHNLYIRRLPGPSPRLLPGFYPYLPPDFKDSEGKTYQKPIRTNKENIIIPINIALYSFFSYFYLRNFFHLQ